MLEVRIGRLPEVGLKMGRAAMLEALARASFTSGDPAGGATWKARAGAEAATIADADDRRVIEDDLASLPG